MRNHHLVPRRPHFRRMRPLAAPAGFDRLFDELWKTTWPAAAGRAAYAPRIDVAETDEAILVSAELPGLGVDDFEVSVDGDVLAIKGERKREEDESDEETGIRHRERRRGAFRRALRLPFEVDADAVAAKYTNGVLEVSVAKPAEPEPSVRTIPVTAS